MLKLTSTFVLVVLGAFALPAVATPVTYNISFTGGYYKDPSGPYVNFAPDPATFTYDPATGFSNFIVDYGPDTFNLTASANTGDPATNFLALTDGDLWSSYETPTGFNYFTYLSLPGGLYDQEAVFPEFKMCCGPPRSGNYVITATPEPGTRQTFGLTILGLLCFGCARTTLRRPQRQLLDR
jgi:hypothetical protein